MGDHENGSAAPHLAFQPFCDQAHNSARQDRWVELNATADGLTANAIPKGQEVLIVIGEGLEKERIEVRLKG